MSIYHYPNYLTFIKNERKTLRFLAEQPFINKAFGSLSRSAETCFYKVTNDEKVLKKSEFIFGCNFDILIEKEIRRIIIEVKILPNFEFATYILSICRNNSAPFFLIRKFHFDYAIPKIKESPKPVYHLQYGGELSPGLDELKIDVNDLHPWLSLPRIGFYPINLALLLDMIFIEFKTEETIRIVGRQEWRDFVKNNEDEILKPYYERISSFLNGEHSHNFLLRDYYYGKGVN